MINQKTDTFYHQRGRCHFLDASAVVLSEYAINGEKNKCSFPIPKFFMFFRPTGFYSKKVTVFPAEGSDQLQLHSTKLRFKVLIFMTCSQSFLQEKYRLIMSFFWCPIILKCLVLRLLVNSYWKLPNGFEIKLSDH